jgi:hypothetical protein
MAVLLLASRIVLPRQAAAETTGIAGRAYHLVTLEPIAGAAVTVGDAQVITDRQGFYKLALPPGRYTVAAEAADYIGMSHMLQPVNENLTTVDFAMIPVDPGEEMSDLIVEQMALLEQTLPVELELAAMAGEIIPSGITQLPETIRLAVRQDPAVIDSPILEVITLDFEEYIKGVVPYEMSPSWPQAALEAQAIAARSYAAANLGKHVADGADVCSSVHCQVWRPTRYATTDRAVDATRGVAATYNGSIIYAFFHSHCDGHTRSSAEVWGGSVPYLQSVPCSCGYTTRLGHGVGMCQYGARAMAIAGATYDQIIKHYYTGVSLLAGPAGTLSEASVEPLAGTENDTYTFRVRYTSSASTRPPMANVIIDGHAHAMSPEGGSPATGWDYVYATRLSSGTHTYRYEFDDGQGRVAKAPAAGTLPGPNVTAVVPSPAPESAMRTSITASTALDWAEGQFSGVQVRAADKDLLTLAAGATQGTYTSPVLPAGGVFVAYGLMWYAQTPDGSSVNVETRSSPDGVNWSAWHTEIGEPYVNDNRWLQSAELVFGEAQFVQYRVSMSGTDAAPPLIRNLRIVFIDSRAGPLASEIDAPATGALATPTIISRATWGANESWMTWAPEYPVDGIVRAMVLHHTVTSDGGVDPAAVVRAIYAYHALPEPYGRGWGDIGYNYLVDASGRIYQGRYGNPGVVGAHAFQYNWGSVGLGMIGNFEDDPVPWPLYDAVSTFLAYQCGIWGINPVGSTYLVDKSVATISGHSDLFPPGSAHPTACPGQYFIPLIPTVRSDTLSKMWGPPPTVQITAPTSGQTVRGVVSLQFSTTGVVTRTSYYVDGVLKTQQDSASAWKWNTTLGTDGLHTLRVVVENAAGWSDAIVTLTVDNTAPSGTVTAPAWTSGSQIEIAISSDATGVAFSQGWTWEGEALYHQTGTYATDPTASQGAAWLGSTGQDGGAWYGPYTCVLSPGAYQALFRLRTDAIGTDTALATLDVVAAHDGVTYAIQPVHADDLPNTSYQEIALPLNYTAIAPACQTGIGGLEFRTWYSGKGNLWLDRVRVFTAPIARQNIHPWPAPSADGLVRLTVRLLDPVGNATERVLVVGIDRTSPTWQGPYGSGYWSQDVTAGLDTAQAAWQQSLDGGKNWGDWQPLPLWAASGEKGLVLYYADVPTEGLVRYRAVDRAGNTSISPAVEAGLERPPLDHKVYLPLLTR